MFQGYKEVVLKISLKVINNKKGMKTMLTSDNISDKYFKNFEINEKQPSDIQIGGYIFSKTKGILAKGKDDDTPQKIAEYARIIEVRSDLFTNEESYVLEYYRSSTKEIIRKRIDGEMLIGSKAEKLVKYGVDINPSNKRQVLTALTRSRMNAINAFVYDVYGWRTLKLGTVFLHANAITHEGPQSCYRQSDSARLDLRPRGSYTDWLSMYNTHVKGNTPLELAVVLGTSSVILNYLATQYPDLKTLIVHLNGQSSQGKTTAAMLALSVGGNPTSNGLLKSWNSTENAIMSHLNAIDGIATCFDELSQNRSANLTSLLYSLAEGKQKDRSNIDGILKETAHWCTTILSTGELSMFNKLDKNLGLRMRILEFTQVQWTVSGNQSEEIKHNVSTNYGHLLPLFVERLLKSGLSSIDQAFEEQRQMLLTKMKDSPTTVRVSMKLAVIMATAYLLDTMGLINLNIDHIRDILIENDRENFDSRDHGAKAMEDVLQYLVEHQSKLVRDNQSRIPNEVIGVLSVKRISGSNQMVISILKAQFDSIMAELKYQDSRVILKDWNQKGLLVTEAGRQTVRMNLDIDGSGKKKVPLYSFLIPDEYKNLFFEPPTYDMSTMLPRFSNNAKMLDEMTELLDVDSDFD